MKASELMGSRLYSIYRADLAPDFCRFSTCRLWHLQPDCGLTHKISHLDQQSADITDSITPFGNRVQDQQGTARLAFRLSHRCIPVRPEVININTAHVAFGLPDVRAAFAPQYPGIEVRDLRM